jgi:hypothetical protein
VSNETVGLFTARLITWPALFVNASALQPASLKLAFLLAVIGYGTKVGLASMHTWLPDAHAEAPSPVSAMLSAALLNTGMYAIIRFHALAGAKLGSYADGVLLVFGFASIAIAAIFMVRRRNFKRLFAYSSVEHMGMSRSSYFEGLAVAIIEGSYSVASLSRAMLMGSEWRFRFRYPLAVGHGGSGRVCSGAVGRMEPDVRGGARPHHGTTIIAWRAHSPSSPSRRKAALPLPGVGA